MKTSAAHGAAPAPDTLSHWVKQAFMAMRREMEATLRALGMARGDRVSGFTFRTPDGAAYALKLAAPAKAKAKVAGDRAA